MAKIKDINGEFTLDPPEAITKIQLLTKTVTSTTDLADIQLEQGEPLFDPGNTEGKHLHIGTGDAKISFYDAAEIDAKINNLDYGTTNDPSDTNQFASQVTQENGQISVTYNQPTASNISYDSSESKLDATTIQDAIDKEASAIAQEAADRLAGDSVLSTALDSLKDIKRNDNGNSNLFVSDIDINNSGNLTLTRSEIALIDEKVSTMLHGKYPTKTVGGIEAKTMIESSSILELLQKMLGIGNAPTYTQPSVILAQSVNGKSNNSYEVEAGTQITVTLTGTFSDGSYSYGPEPTGCSVTKWLFKDFNDSSFSSSNNPKTYNAVNIGNNTALSGVYTYTAKAEYDEGSPAYDVHAETDNPPPVYGGEDTDKQIRIPAGTTSPQSTSIKWYWNAFAGSTQDIVSITSNILRNTDNFSRKPLTSDISNFEFTAKEGAKQVVFAYPSRITKTPTFEMYTVSWGSANGFVKEESTIEIAGASSDLKRKYSVYIYKPRSPFANDTKFRVSLDTN